jgi:septal ring factor EnvC (AmiA/AmiB activator)
MATAVGLPRDEALAQLNQARQEIKEVDMMLEQSQLEVNRLSQRNAQTTSALQRVHMNFDSVPRTISALLTIQPWIASSDFS